MPKCHGGFFALGPKERSTTGSEIVLTLYRCEERLRQKSDRTRAHILVAATQVDQKAIERIYGRKLVLPSEVLTLTLSFPQQQNILEPAEASTGRMVRHLR